MKLRPAKFKRYTVLLEGAGSYTIHSDIMQIYITLHTLSHPKKHQKQVTEVALYQQV